MNFRLAAPDQSLNAPIGVDNEAEWQDRLVVDFDARFRGVFDGFVDYVSVVTTAMIAS